MNKIPHLLCCVNSEKGAQYFTTTRHPPLRTERLRYFSMTVSEHEQSADLTIALDARYGNPSVYVAVDNQSRHNHLRPSKQYSTWRGEAHSGGIVHIQVWSSTLFFCEKFSIAHVAADV